MSTHTLSTERLAPIHDLAEKREADAARMLADAQRLLADREAQLRELENYKEPVPTQGAPALQSAALMRNRELFRLRLAEAIRFQRQAVADARARVESARNVWLMQRRQTKVYEKLIQRGEAAEQREQERREQRDYDELALRQARDLPSGQTLDS
jgi:flagellar FliJ protein